MMRCFVAIDLPENIKNILGKIQEQIKNCDEDYGLRASFNKHHHITLKFLGDLDSDKIELVKNNLSSCKVRSFLLTTDTFGVFPNKKNVRILWLSAKPEDKVIKLQQQIDELLKKDFRKERNFQSHITLARVKSLNNQEKFLQWLKQLDFEKKNFEVTNFKLMCSTLKPEGPLYTELATYKT